MLYPFPSFLREGLPFPREAGNVLGLPTRANVVALVGTGEAETVPAVVLLEGNILGGWAVVALESVVLKAVVVLVSIPFVGVPVA